MPTPLITPNLHVILIHFPLAFLMAGTLIEFFSFMWPRSGFRVAGRWMILIGALAGLPAVYSGIYAMRDIARVEDAHWYDLKGGPTHPGLSAVYNDPAIWHLLRTHLLIQLTATLVCVTVVAVWIGCSDRGRHLLHWPLLLLLLAATGATGVGAWFGGELIYRQGVAVEKVYPPLKQETPPPTTVERLFPVLELHVLGAGLVSALAAVSIGLSFRKINAVYNLNDIRPIKPSQQRLAPVPATMTSTDAAMARSLNQDVTLHLGQLVPAARFWLLTLLIAFVTASGGLFYLCRDSGIPKDHKLDPQKIKNEIWEQIQPARVPRAPGVSWVAWQSRQINRKLAHTVVGSCIVVLPVFLALFARFAPRQRLLLSLTTALLLAAIALQVWLGVLLLFDGSDGTILRLNPATATASR